MLAAGFWFRVPCLVAAALLQAVANIGDVSDVQLAINWLLDHGAMAWEIE